MRRERSSRPRTIGIGLLAAVILIGGSLVAVAPATAQEPEERALRQRLEEVLARQERAVREQAAREREMVARRQAEIEALEGRLRGLSRGMRPALAPLQELRHRVRVGGPGDLRILARSSSVERILAHAEELGLDDAQVDQIRSAHRDHRRAEIERDAAIEVAELDLEDLMHDDAEMDLQAVESKMMEIAGLRVQSRVADLRLRQRVESLLTAEQRDKLDEMGGGFLFRSGDGPAHFFFRDGDGMQWGRLLEEQLEPLREFEWQFDHDHDDDGDDHEDDEVGVGVIGA